MNCLLLVLLLVLVLDFQIVIATPMTMTGMI
jgi:hypothetical protein